MNELKTELYQTSQYHPQTIVEKKQKKIREMVLNSTKVPMLKLIWFYL